MPKQIPPPALSRRHFLKSSAGAAASLLAAPFILRSTGFGQGPPVSPNGRINLGLIGNGNIMVGHRRAYLTSPLARVVAVCDVNRSKLKVAQEEVERALGECAAYENYEEVLARPDIDAVVVGTPDQWHAAISIAAMKAGKDVYVEKPMTLTIDESQAMVAAANRYQRVVQVGSQQRSDWAFRKAAEIVRNGWIGEVREVYAKLGDFDPPVLLPPEKVPEGFNYDKWLGPAPFVPYYPLRVLGLWNRGWRQFWDYGSRKNGDWGAHHFDIIQWALDMDDSGPTLFVPAGFEGEKYQYHQYANGVKVVRDHPDMKGFQIRFIGSEGEVLVSRGGQIKSIPSELASRPLSPGDIHLYASNDHRVNWLECIRTRGQTICDVNNGRRTSELCGLATIAERIGRPVRWDPEKAVILDDPAAAAWTNRTRREGYPLPV